MAVIALAMIGLGVGGWIGLGLAVMLLKGRFKLALAAVFSVGGIVAAIMFSHLVIPVSYAESILADAKEHDATFQLGMAKDPSNYGHIQELMRLEEQRGGKAAAETIFRDNNFEILTVHGYGLIPKASDRSVSDYALAIADYYTSIHGTDPEKCYLFLTESQLGHHYGMSPKQRQRVYDSLTKVVETASRSPVTMTDNERAAANEKMSEIWTGIVEGPDAAALYMGEFEGEKARTAEQRKGMCLFYTRLHQRIAATDPPLRSHLIKVFNE